MGVAFNQIALGVSLGIALGAIAGAVLNDREHKKADQLTSFIDGSQDDLRCPLRRKIGLKLNFHVE